MHLPQHTTCLALIFSLLVFLPLTTQAQERCATVEYSNELKQQQKVRESDAQFENWLTRKKELRQRSAAGSAQSRTQATPYKIPVVIHVVHNGEAIGQGANISNQQILSQLRVLNEDFQRKNTDKSNTPAAFTSLAGSLDIEFVLAKQTPEGLPTSGIVRVRGSKTGWSMNDNYQLKALSYWPAENYLNIWVCVMSGDFLGYAQFPVSDLAGLEDSPNNRLTDGVVISHLAFGSDDDGDFDLEEDFNKGRTTTHELSHFFGLRHIWGDDDNCTGTDYVDDTPNQAKETRNCQTHPYVDACSSQVMFQNFLDYTDDRCMNLFTKGQISRMVTVIENSPRRKSLLTSPGLQSPTPVANDLGIKRIVSPSPVQCDVQIIPSIEVRNYGNNAVTQAKLRYKIDNTIQVKDVALNLSPLDSAIVDFPSLTLSSGSEKITFEILSTNATTDGKRYNDTASISFTIPEKIAIPFDERFTSFSDSWTIQNNDNVLTWRVVSAANGEPNNKAALMNFFDYEDNMGERDVLLSPVFDLTNVQNVSLLFDVAYARYENRNDRLDVVVITDCIDILDGTTVYSKSGQALATTKSSTLYYTPKSASEWRNEFINLNAFIGQKQVQLAFVGINDWGNNVYLDNISLVTAGVTDIAINQIISPSLVTCDDSPAPRIMVQNTGSENITSYTIQYRVNEGAFKSVKVTGINLSSGEETEVAIPELDLTQTQNTISVTVGNPNGLPQDHNARNNTLSTTVVISQFKDRIPLRQNFEVDNSVADWTIVNPNGGANWQPVETNFNNSIYFNSFNNEAVGDESWLVSPVLDFSKTATASMKFDVSYRSGEDRFEDFSILASSDCGNTYTELEFNFPSADASVEEWKPEGENDWESVEVRLSDFAGSENVRLAFVVNNENGNNIYLDNIEFYLTEEPQNIDIEAPYAVFGYDTENLSQSQLKVGFYLEERGHVTCQIVDTMGKLIAETQWEDVLNQTFDLPFNEPPPTGIYIVRLKINSRYYSTRIFTKR